jgi:aminoglycoside 3-N-acetyltransferase
MMPATGNGHHHTRDSLADSLRTLNVGNYTTLLVHSSLRNLGPVDGGAGTVLAAIQDVIGPDGTVVVPAFTSENSLTSRAYKARTAGMTPAQIAAHQTTMKPFNPLTSPSTGMGYFAEHVRNQPGAARSAHPQTSFAAVGRRAAKLMAEHAIHCHLGPGSPLAKIADDPGAAVLMLGAGPHTCTAFHFAEYQLPNPPMRSYTCVVDQDGAAVWRTFDDVDLDDGDFADLGRALENERPRLRTLGKVGDADSWLLDLDGAVAYAREWFGRHR